MNKKYNITINGTFWYPGNYEDKYSINIVSEDKGFIDFIDMKILEIIEEYKGTKKK